MRGEWVVARDRAPLASSACCQRGAADVEDTWQLGGAHVLLLVMLDVLMMMNVIMDVLVMKVMKVMGQVNLLLQALVQVKAFVLLVVKVVVEGVFGGGGGSSLLPLFNPIPKNKACSACLGLGR